MKTHELICINCPAGCHLTARQLDNGSFEVEGNNCPRGKTYAINEMTDPRRIVTATVAVKSEHIPCLPVKTDAPLPVKLIPALLQKIYTLELELPVKTGMVLISDFEGSKVNVVLTRGAGK